MRTFTQKLAFLLMTLLWSVSVQAQEVITLNGDITKDLTPGESYLFYDSGGPTGDYGASQTYTAVLTNAGGSITINFSALATESSSSCYNWDYMLIYDDEELIGRAQTGCASATITTGQDYVAQSGTLKIEWHSDGSSFAAGWEATITAEGGGGPTCDKPESVEANDVTANSATINWTGLASTYNLQYKASTDADWTLVKNLSGNFYQLSNLVSNTAYQVQVQAICGENTSGWKSVSFTTLVGLPYAEHFASSSIPTGWGRYTGALNADGSATLTPATSYWTFGTSNDVFDSHAHMEVWSTRNAWLVTPTIPIPALEPDDPGYLLSFNMALTYYSGNNVPCTSRASQPDARFVVLASLDGGVNWNILREWNNTGSEYVYDDIVCSADGEEV